MFLHDMSLSRCILWISHCSNQHVAVFPVLLSSNDTFYTSRSRKLIWLQQRPENVTPRITRLVSVTSEALMELYLPRPASAL